MKGIFPTIKNVLPKVVKSALWGDDICESEYIENGLVTQSFFQMLIGSHSFNRKGLQYLVETGYTNNPAGFGIINKILLAQKNIIFTPYWNGKPYKSKKITFDLNFALQMLVSTGTVVLYKKKIVGFGEELEVLNTLRLTETYIGANFKYKYVTERGLQINITEDEVIIITLYDVSKSNITRFGISPLQAALMPIESLNQMYVADTSALKNKGADVMITNDSDEPLLQDQNKSFDQAINERVRGARKSGSIATSTAKLRVLNLGRTTKELALWDGYKIKIRDFCNVLQLDSSQFNDPDNKKYANVKESNKALYNDCVIPFTRIITENKELRIYLGYDIYLDVSQIDSLQEAQSLRMEKNRAIMEALFELNQKVKDGVITYDIAIKILVSELGYDELEASELIVVREQDIQQTIN